jgi:glutathione S-transferase
MILKKKKLAGNFPWVSWLHTGIHATEYFCNEVLGRRDTYPAVDAWVKKCAQRPTFQCECDWISILHCVHFLLE